jgi:glucan phosphoethanolaminetransferase (alkaline phosphatase superfamily)
MPPAWHAGPRRAGNNHAELEQRPWWWLMLSGLAMIVLVDWFTSRWERPAWRAAMLWTLTMAVALVVVVTLTVRFGWGMRPVGL